jgi:predicted ATPase/DNA-binding XRE family transcriptional regulator
VREPVERVPRALMPAERAGPASFRELLKQFRLARGFTQEDLAEAAAISAVTISSLERDERKHPYRDTVAKLATALQLTAEQRETFERAAIGRRRKTGPARALPQATPASGALHSVPIALTRLFGRARELQELQASLARYRLITLVGPGGVGKTRLASELARAVAERFPDGVYFVDFAPVTETGAAAAAVAGALALREAVDQPTLDAVVGALRPKRALLLFDNCEQIVQACADLAQAILTNAPQVAIIATSRERLHIDGEYSFPVRPLPASDRHGAAVELFLDRAAAVTTGHLDPDDVVSLCGRLDGIPLALELAAARLDAMPLRALIAGLDARFRVMNAGNRSGPARHSGLGAALDWSYDLLAPAERAAFRRCGVFSGGFSFDAFRAVAASTEAPAEMWGAWDLLASLVNKSLVMPVETDLPENRYYLLETMRAYALEKLAETGEAVARRHAEWVAGFAGAEYERHWAEPRRPWLAEVQPEIDNARAALAWALSGAGDPLLAGRIAAALGPFWAAAGLRSEGREWSHAALAAGAGSRPEIGARLWLSLAQLSVAKESVDAADRALPFYETSGERLELGIGYYARAFGLMQMGEPVAALESIDRCLSLWNGLTVATKWPYAAALETKGNILTDLGRGDEARGLCNDALRLYRAAGDEQRAAGAQLNLAELVFAAGDTRQAVDLADAAIALVRRLHVTNLEAIALVNATGYRLVLGDIEAAAALARDALAVARSGQIHSLVTVALQHLATIAALRGDTARAARLLGYVDAWYARERYAREPTEQKAYDLLTASIRARLPEAEREALAREGAAYAEDEAADVAAAAEP